MKLILEKWSRTCSLKTFFIIVSIIITLQYLVNLSIYVNEKAAFYGGPRTSYWSVIKNMSGLYNTVSTTTIKPMNLSECPIIPPGLQGRVEVNTQIPAWAHIEEENPQLEPGGRYKPPDCIARNRVAIVIPFRDREIHLKLFLQNLHPFLQRQQLDYGIFVVEMANGIQFNRALLMNVGFVEAMNRYDYQCFIFHDVDLLPEDDRNLYTCPSMPRHMSSAIDKLKYRLPYSQIFGGVSAISTAQFRQINGFSNIYFGWGGEDDDIYRRILYSQLTVIRYPNNVARYKMLVHKKASGNPERFKLLKTVKMRQESDGISSLQYKLIKFEEKPLFTWILVSVNMTAIVNSEPIHKRLVRPLKQTPVKSVMPDVNKHSSSKPQVAQKGQNNDKLVKKVDPPKKMINQATKKRSPEIVSWVPEDYQGEVPDYLTKFTSAKFVFEPAPQLQKPAAKKPSINGQVQSRINKQLQQQKFIQLRKQQIQERARLSQAQNIKSQNNTR